MADLLALSLKREVEALIHANEGSMTMTVLSDFREGFEQREANHRVKWCLQWMGVYRTLTSMNRVSLARTR